MYEIFGVNWGASEYQDTTITFTVYMQKVHCYALNQTLQSFGNILKLTFSVQHLTFVNLLFIDFTQR